MMVSLLALATMTCPRHDILVPMLSVSSDGQVADDEYEGAFEENFKNTQLYLCHDAKSLYIGIETTVEGIASVFLRNQDTIRVFHASAALD